MQDQVKLLDKEKTKQEERRKAGTKLFRSWKNHLLADVSDHSKTADAFLAHCILPRCIQTPEDATYCAAFVRRLVLEDTPFFSFMYFMQQVRVPLLPAVLRTARLVADQSGLLCM